MKTSRFKRTATIALILISVLFGWKLFSRLADGGDKGKKSRRSRPMPVEVAEIQHGTIELKRSFSGALEATAKFTVAPKVSGRVVKLGVDISDTVSRGQVVAELDSGEYVQAVAVARADVAVARAKLAEATSVLQIAVREVKRIENLLKKNIAHESQHDEVKLKELEKLAQLEVAKAQLARAGASLETANIRLGYTKVKANWTSGGAKRVVSERYVDEGDTISANAPMVQIVELDTIVGVFFATEKDYSRLKLKQTATLVTDAYPGESFRGAIERIAPVFRQSTRQVRLEMIINNPDHRLKPGMFVRAAIVLGKVHGATMVPEQAVTVRKDRPGVFVVSGDGKTVSWREVKVGVREGGRAQIESDGLSGRVVTLGQHLLDDGSAISIPADEDSNQPDKRKKKKR